MQFSKLMKIGLFVIFLNDFLILNVAFYEWEYIFHIVVKYIFYLCKTYLCYTIHENNIYDFAEFMHLY
jgi:hypothetical protein